MNLIFSTNESADKLKRVEKEFYNIESRRKQLTDMMLDDKMTKEAYNGAEFDNGGRR